MFSKVTPAVVLAAALALLAALPARAGWRIEEVDPEFPKEVTTYGFQGGVARVEGALEGLTVLIDLRKQEGWLIDLSTKRYAGGKISDLAEQLKKIEPESTAEEQAAGEETLPGDAPAGPRNVVIKDLGAGERLLGFDTHRYQVLVDGEVLEELWMSPKVDVEREADLAAFALAMQKMLGGGSGMNQGYEDNPGYRKLRASGYPLKQVLYFVGEKSALEVKSAEVKTFSDTDLAVPKGYTKTGYVELLVGESGK